MTARTDRLIQWLRDAHAMEGQAETMLKAQAGRLEHYPELKARIEQHVGETQGQAERLERCLAQLGSSTSGAKDAMGSMTAMMQGMGGALAGDEVIKGAMAGYTFEHFEISSYTVLIATARAAGEEGIAATCEEILAEEKAMADWMQQHLPAVTEEYLAREEAGEPAKR